MIISFLIVYHKTNANNFEEVCLFSVLSCFSKTALVLCEFADGKAVKTGMDEKRYKKVSIC